MTFKGLKAGRLRVEITMKDKAGNAARTVVKSATVRSRQGAYSAGASSSPWSSA